MIHLGPSYLGSSSASARCQVRALHWSSNLVGTLVESFGAASSWGWVWEGGLGQRHVFCGFLSKQNRQVQWQGWKDLDSFQNSSWKWAISHKSVGFNLFWTSHGHPMILPTARRRKAVRSAVAFCCVCPAVLGRTARQSSKRLGTHGKDGMHWKKGTF